MNAGKGSIPRKVDKKKFDKNFEEIYRKNHLRDACEKVAKLREKK
jgi:hypothetical protein